MGNDGRSVLCLPHSAENLLRVITQCCSLVRKLRVHTFRMDILLPSSTRNTFPTTHHNTNTTRCQNIQRPKSMALENREILRRTKYDKNFGLELNTPTFLEIP
jgi:hypothetical protein